MVSLEASPIAAFTYKRDSSGETGSSHKKAQKAQTIWWKTSVAFVPFCGYAPL
jgi:hypothetical protein